ncbi:MAG TPA: hypothetical protein VK062_00210 [Burkholderiaceae bacterium]|nr:hypothetical protein [Burkholderiaceae bacterium]
MTAASPSAADAPATGAAAGVAEEAVDATDDGMAATARDALWGTAGALPGWDGPEHPANATTTTPAHTYPACMAFMH